MQLNRYIRLFSASLLLFALSMSAVAQRQSSKAAPKAASQPNTNLISLSLEEATAKAMVFGQDGMLYILNEQGGRYNKGALYRLDPEAFSRLLRDKNNRYHAQPDDLTEVYVFGRPGEPDSDNPSSIIAGADGKLYISGHWQSCARYDPAKQSVEWVKYGPDNLPYGDPNQDLQMAWGSCFAATADGLLWCRKSGEGSPGKVFHTRGAGKDLGGITGTEQWAYAALGADGYLYGATDDALIRVKKPDGSDITVLHAFAGKNDHPVGAPILVGRTLFGCAHDDPRTSGQTSRSGYIYKLNSDGTGYSSVVKLDYDPDKLPFVAHGGSLYGIAPESRNVRPSASKPAGLFTLSINQPAPKIIAPIKERPYRAALAISDNAAYLLWAPNQVDAGIFRVPISGSASASASSPPAQAERAAAAPASADTAGVATSNQTATGSAAVPPGKSVFHKRQSTDDSQAAEGASAGSSPNAADEGMATQARPGLPPRQSKAPAKASSTSGDSESSFSSSKESLTPEQFAKLKAERRMANTGRKSERDDVESSGASSVGGGSVEDTSDVSGIADRIAQGFSNGDIDTLNSLYADTVDYLDSGPISSADVQSQIQEYFTRWPVRQWTITSPVKVKSMGGSVQQLTFSARYTVSDPQTGRRASGTARETLLLQPDASGAMKIISQHEKTSAEKSGGSGGHRHEKVYDGKPVDNERPIIHLPPNIPWPPGIPRP